MEAQGDDFSMVYVPEAGVSTSPVPENLKRGLTVTPEMVGDQGVDAVLRQSQSYANSETLSREFAKADPSLSKQDRATLRRFIFRHFDEVARMMVDDPELTKDSPQIQQHLAQLREVVTKFAEGRGRARRSQPLQDVTGIAHDIMLKIIEAATGAEFRRIWFELKDLLDKIAQERQQQGGGAQQ